MRLVDRFRQWMVGRYGTDQLNMALLVLYLIISVVSSFTGLGILMFVSYAVIILVFYRMFSKDTARRYQENQRFLKAFTPIKNRVGQTAKQKADKNYKYYRCKNCGQMIRVPRGKGKIAITCPKCRTEFIKRT